MPIRVQNDLPVKEILEHENIFVMDEYRAAHQDIRPISIGLLNLMPLKEDTERIFSASLQLCKFLTAYLSQLIQILFLYILLLLCHFLISFPG